MTTTKLKSDI